MSNGKKWKEERQRKKPVTSREHTKIGGPRSKFRFLRNKKYVKKIFENDDHFGISKLRNIEMRFWRL